MVEKHNLILRNTFFCKKPQFLYTFRTPGTGQDAPITLQTHRQLDHILCARRWRRNVTNIYADPDVIVQPPEKEISLPSEDVHFRLEADTMKRLEMAARCYSLEDLCLFCSDGTMHLTVTDKKNDTSNSFSVEVGKSDQQFCYCFKVENLKLLPADYDVTVSKHNVALFKGPGIKYYIAMEPNA